MNERSRTMVVEAALAAPSLLWLAAAGAVLLAVGTGYRALAAPSDLRLPEAAALRAQTEVVRQIRAGADPNAPDWVRTGVLRGQAYLLTPLEAAVAAGHVESVRLLMAFDAEVNTDNFPVLFCLAQERQSDDLTALLQERAPDVDPFECEDVDPPI